LFALRTALTMSFARLPIDPNVAAGLTAFTLGFYMTAIAPFLFRLVGVGREPPAHHAQGLVTEEPA
jgi:hypothetical protein